MTVSDLLKQPYNKSDNIMDNKKLDRKLLIAHDVFIADWRADGVSVQKTKPLRKRSVTVKSVDNNV